jgi:hypothetical protein
VKDFLSNYKIFQKGSSRPVIHIQDFKNDLEHSNKIILENLKKTSKSKPPVEDCFTLQVKTSPEPVLKPVKTNSNLLDDLKILTFQSKTQKSKPSSKDLSKISKDLGRMVNHFRTSDLLSVLIKIQEFEISTKDLKDFKLTKIMKILIFSLENRKGDTLNDLSKIMKFIYAQWKVNIAKKDLQLAYQLDGLKETLEDFEKNLKKSLVSVEDLKNNEKICEFDEKSNDFDENSHDSDENSEFEENFDDYNEESYDSDRDSFDLDEKDSSFDEKEVLSDDDRFSKKVFTKNRFQCENIGFHKKSDETSQESKKKNQEDSLTPKKIFEIKKIEPCSDLLKVKNNDFLIPPRVDLTLESKITLVNYMEIVMPQPIRMYQPAITSEKSEYYNILKTTEETSKETSKVTPFSPQPMKTNEILEENQDLHQISPNLSNQVKDQLEAESRENSMRRTREKIRKNFSEKNAKVPRKKAEIFNEKTKKAKKSEKNQKLEKKIDEPFFDLSLQQAAIKEILKVFLEKNFTLEKSEKLSVMIEENLRKKDPSMGEKYKKLAKIMLKDIKTLDNQSFDHICASLV